MALKVVPADDERCDIHNGRNPPEYICKSCLKELGVEPEPAVTARGGPIRSARRALRRGPVRQARRAIRLRSRGAHRILIGAGIGLLIGAIVVAVVLAVGGRSGGGNETGLPSEADVVQALDLSPNPSGTGWITLDGGCAVLTIEIGRGAQSGKQSVNPAVATNEDETVRAVVQNYLSASEAACVDQISTALRDHF